MVHIHQFHPTVAFGDAVSNQMLEMRRSLRRMGYVSEIFCEQAPIQFQGRWRLIKDYQRYASSENVLLLHFSLGYPPAVLKWLKSIPDRKILVYHNITPAHYFRGINEVYLEAARAGREQLGELATLTEAGWGDSAFNCQELLVQGWEHTAVLPIIFNPRRYRARPDRSLLRAWQSGFTVLFVGRVSPNKCFEDLLITFAYFKRHVCPDARLILVGSARGTELYQDYLNQLVTRLHLHDVVFTGHISQSRLAAAYRSADVYLSMSEHEGFGVPLLESMYYDVPLVAYAAAAVPETLGDSGVLFSKKDGAAIAELLGVLAEEPGWRERLVARQRARWQMFTPQAVYPQLRSLLDAVGV